MRLSDISRHVRKLVWRIWRAPTPSCRMYTQMLNILKISKNYIGSKTNKTVTEYSTALHTVFPAFFEIDSITRFLLLHVGNKCKRFARHFNFVFTNNWIRALLVCAIIDVVKEAKKQYNLWQWDQRILMIYESTCKKFLILFFYETNRNSFNWI